MNTDPNFRYHPSTLIIQILLLLFISLEAVDFILEALYVIDGAFEDGAFVGLADVKVLNDVVEKLVRLRQQRSQFFNSVVNVKSSSSFNCKLNETENVKNNKIDETRCKN